ncbi:MAG: aquaporin family protein [Planctomycetota bacterium]|nr:MAG: aquaporin family protein [Planctomycetota bacterium]
MAPTPEPPLRRQVVAELIGTYLLILFGCGAVHAAVLTGAQSGLWQVAIVWGVAIMLAIYSIGSISGAHINPAMTIALAVHRGFPWKNVGPYIAGQLTGAILAAGTLFILFSPHLAALEKLKGVERGQPGSEMTAMCYGEYFPAPGSLGSGTEPYSAEKHAELKAKGNPGQAFLAELLGTAVLAFVVFAVTDDRNSGRPAAGQAPIFIGLTVAVLISVIAPLTQACFNPARDLGPRLFAYFAGWGAIALPGFTDLSWLTVYIVAPMAGSLVGGAVYDFAVRPAAGKN